MIKSKIPVILCMSVLAFDGCSSGMRMSGIPSPGDSTSIGKIKVKVVDLEVGNASRIAPPPSSIPPELVPAVQNTKYKVGPFDVLIVTVWEHPELTQPLGQYRNDLASGQLVDADGTMFFPYVGRIPVAGLTATEIQKQVTSILAKVLRDPQVDIKVAAYRSQRVYVSGEVRNPGIQIIDDVPMTIPEALNRAGGLLPTGDASAVRLVRGSKVYELDIESLERSGAPLESIQLLPGDQIRVPNLEERVAYVIGEVARPTILKLTNGRTNLVRGLTEAGGIDNLTANAAGIYVVRPMDSTNVTVFRLDGRSPVALAWAGQFQIRPRDLIYVDQSGLNRWSRVFQLLVPMSAVLSNTTGSGENIRLMKTQPW